MSEEAIANRQRQRSTLSVCISPPRTGHLDEEQAVGGELCADVPRSRDLPRPEDLAEAIGESTGGGNHEKQRRDDGEGDHDVVGVGHHQRAGAHDTEHSADGQEQDLGKDKNR